MATKTQFKAPWWQRRVIYLVVSALGLVAAGFGLLDEGQLDAIAASPLLATLVGLFAATKTHEGSDSRATDAQVDQVADLREMVDQVRDQVRSDPARIAQEVLKVIWGAESGRHALETTEETTAPGEASTEVRGVSAVADYYQGGNSDAD